MAPPVLMIVLMVSMSDRYLFAQFLGYDFFLAIKCLATIGLPIFIYQSFYISYPAITLPLYSSLIMFVK